MLEDRIVLLQKAGDFATAMAERFSMNKYVLFAFCEVAIQLARYTGEARLFESAIRALRNAEPKMGDPDITQRIARFENQFRGIPVEEELEVDALEI